MRTSRAIAVADGRPQRPYVASRSGAVDSEKGGKEEKKGGERGEKRRRKKGRGEGYTIGIGLRCVDSKLNFG